MARISFTSEAAESFANLLQHIQGYTVEIVPEYTDFKQPEPFDAVVLGSAADTTNDYFGIRVRRYDDDEGGPVGEPFDVIVSEIRVY